MENKFKKGLILGGLLTAGAVLGFINSKAGKELAEDAQNDLKVLAKHLKNSLHKLEDVTKERFDELATATVEEYAKNRQLANDVKETLTTALRAKWQDMEEEYLTDKEEEKK